MTIWDTEAQSMGNETEDTRCQLITCLRRNDSFWSTDMILGDRSFCLRETRMGERETCLNIPRKRAVQMTEESHLGNMRIPTVISRRCRIVRIDHRVLLLPRHHVVLHRDLMGGLREHQFSLLSWGEILTAHHNHTPEPWRVRMQCASMFRRISPMRDIRMREQLLRVRVLWRMLLRERGRHMCTITFISIRRRIIYCSLDVDKFFLLCGEMQGRRDLGVLVLVTGDELRRFILLINLKREIQSTYQHKSSAFQELQVPDKQLRCKHQQSQT